MITNKIPALKIHKVTREQYDREFSAGRIDENAMYFTPDNVVDTDRIMDLESDQTARGIKTFANGITIGDEGVRLDYDSAEHSLKVLFLNSTEE